MTRQIPLPTAETAAHARQDLTRQANVTGRRVSVSGLARRLGLPNTTLRRHYPDVIDEMGTAGPLNHPGRRKSHDEESGQTANRLRSENPDLRTHLDIAITHIQRLTIENDQLRRQAETASQIRRIPRDG